MLSDTALNEYKAVLEAEKKRLFEELSTIAILTPETGDWNAVPNTELMDETDENAEADAVEDWNERRATVAALETEYQDVLRALKKIVAGTYGICEISGEPIEEERLAVRPTARTCTQHQEEEYSLAL